MNFKAHQVGYVNQASILNKEYILTHVVTIVT